jgi:para-aminobenzoate synthetase
MKLFSQVLEGWVDPSDVFIALHGEDANAFWLDREFNPSNQFSVIGGAAKLLSGSTSAELSEALSGFVFEDDDSLPFEFRPGLVGAFGFEPENNLWMLVDRALVFDHSRRHIFFIGVFNNHSEFEHFTNAALLRLALVGGQQGRYRIAHGGGELGRATLRHSEDSYLDLIGRAQNHIASGDVYQLCLTNEIVLEATVDPLMTYLRLRALNPAPYAAFMRFGSRSVVCASPEQFLTVDSNRMLSTKPIKGTRPRGENPEEDSAIAAELATNEKERAENLMIVDLMRNDFGRVCQTGSVEVSSLFEVESYATVHQLVSTVVGRLAEDASVFDAIDAAFPGGSMTGAPKLRAIEIIDELEGGQRGIYSGALGFISSNGSSELGMTIRTIVFEGALARIGVGGGITIDSDARAELDETKLKAAALLRALGAEDPWLIT